MTLTATQREFREIPLGLLDPPRLPSRVGMDEESLDELARDIRLKGLIVPLIVAQSDQRCAEHAPLDRRAGERSCALCRFRYEIVAGHRRSLAAQRAGLVAVMCCVYPSYDVALTAVQYSENRFRTDLSPAEEAILFSDLLERDCAGDVDRLCELLGERRAYVEARLNLFGGCKEVFTALLESKISLGVAQQLNKCSDDTMRRYFLDAAVRGGATVAVVAGWVQQWGLDTGARPLAPGGGTAAIASAPVVETNYFTCAVCRGTDHVHTMQPVNVHSHCKLAVLDKLLATYHGEA